MASPHCKTVLHKTADSVFRHLSEIWKSEPKFGFQTHKGVWNPNSQKFKFQTVWISGVKISEICCNIYGKEEVFLRFNLLFFQVGGKKGAAAFAAMGKGTKAAAGRKVVKEEVLPSPHGIRVAPKIPDELRKRAAQAVAAKDRKDGKVRCHI